MTKKEHSPNLNRVHFVGIGGIGMSALVRWFLAKKWLVSGSDLVESQITDSLRKVGVRVKIGHKRVNLPQNGLKMVVYSQAIHHDNPELLEARKLGIIPLSYGEAVGCLTKIYKTIAIAGSHGKSTTTALVGIVLSAAKFDPNVILGTNLKEFHGTNFRQGRSRWLVLEADEWKASFLNYFPFITVVTNIDKEHLDYYKTFGNVKKTFLKFLGNTEDGGFLILNRDDKILFSLQSSILKLTRQKKLKVHWYSVSKTQSEKRKAKSLGKILKISGEHNISNAMAAFTVAKVLRIKESIATGALANFQGAWRRMEYKGKWQIANSKSILVFDDYAHHPTEIRATLRAFHEKFSTSPIVCVYQPHQAERLKNLFSEFVDSFLDAHVLIFLPVYEVAGRDRVNRGFTSERLAKAIAKKYSRKHVYYLKNPKLLKGFLRHIVEHFGFTHSPILVMMGAGDIVKYTPLLLS